VENWTMPSQPMSTCTDQPWISSCHAPHFINLLARLQIPLLSGLVVLVSMHYMTDSGSDSKISCLVRSDINSSALETEMWIWCCHQQWIPECKCSDWPPCTMHIYHNTPVMDGLVQADHWLIESDKASCHAHYLKPESIICLLELIMSFSYLYSISCVVLCIV
jgi:hypothetical protein